jgi:RNA polymerase sigma-70 factor, ECF subfamily
MIAVIMVPMSARHSSGRTPSASEDAQILAEVAQGNLRRFDVLVNRYQGRLINYIAQRVPDRHHAEDLAQEAFLRMFRAARMGGYSGQAQVSTWLFTIADNCATDYLRATGRHPVALESDLPRGDDPDPPDMLARRPSPDADPAEAAVRRESQTRVDRLLASLPDQQRRVVALKVLGGLTFVEIAEAIGAPLTTVTSRMAYGLEKVRAIIEQERERRHE